MIRVYRKIKHLSFGSADSNHMQLQNHLFHIEDQIQWKKAKPNHLRTIDNWS